MAEKIRVTVWNEFRHEKEADKEPAKVYPDGIHRAIADHLGGQDGIEVGTATLDEPEHGLTDEVLNSTDVMIWWGHKAHKDVSDEIAAKVQRRVLEGMGLIVLHSGHFSKPFKMLMGTTCQLKWREVGESEVLWNTCPGHPILDGIGEYFTLGHEEMYGEHFDVPAPDQLLLIASFDGGEVFRSGMVWQRGAGRVFYFQPGHETYPIYRDANVLKIITNAVRYLRPTGAMEIVCPNKKMGWWKEASAK
jgi:trehalose utilization protein